MANICKVLQPVIQPVINRVDNVCANNNLPPYSDDLYPVPNGKGVCGISNSGGRLLEYDGTINVIDKIGVRTGKIKEDNCITKDTSGGGCVLDSTINATLWAYGVWINKTSYFKYTDGVNTYTYINGILDSTVSGSSHLALTELAFQQGANYYHILFDLTGLTASEINDFMTVNACLWHIDNMTEDSNFLYHRWLLDEGVNSNSPTAIDSGSVLDANKVNGTLYYDDINKTDASIRNTCLYPEHLLNRLNRDGYNVLGGVNIPQNMANIGYDTSGNVLVNKGRVKFNAKIEGGTVGEFDGNSYITDSYKVQSGNSYTCLAIVKQNDASGQKAIYSNGEYNVNGLSFFNNANPVGSSYMRSYISDNSSVNPFNSKSLNLNVGSYNKCAWAYSDAERKHFLNGTLDKLVVSGYSLQTALTDSFYGAFSISSWNYSGDIAEILLYDRYLTDSELTDWNDNGTIPINPVKEFYLNGHSINSITGIAATNHGVTFKDITDYTPQSTIDSLAKTVYKDVAGNLIVNPQYPATTETVLSGKGFKGVGIRNYDPQISETYYSFKDNSVIDPLFNDVTKWTAANWAISGGVATHSGTASDNLTSTTANPAVVGKEYRIEDIQAGTTVTYGGQTFVNGDIKTAINTNDLAITSNVDGANISTIKVQEAVKHVDANSALIGFRPHLIKNMACYVGNPLGLPEYYLNTAEHLNLINWNDLYQNPYGCDDYDTVMTAKGKGYIYELKKNGVVTKEVIYANKKSIAENTKINNKKYCPPYNL